MDYCCVMHSDQTALCVCDREILGVRGVILCVCDY